MRPAPQETPSPAPAPENPAPSPEQPAPLPRLTPIVGEDEAREHRKAIDTALARSEQNLRGIEQRTLNERQANMLAQARDFDRQARAMRDSDVRAARSLAERSEQLSRELLSSLR